MSRYTRNSLLAAALAGVVVLTPVSPAQAVDERQEAYARAAAEFGVPESVLLAVSYLESRWDVNAGTPSTSGGFGPMHLTDAALLSAGRDALPDHGDDRRGDDSRASEQAPHGVPDNGPPAAALQTIDPASALSGESKQALRSDPAANIRGGAALLRRYQEEIQGPVGSATDPAAWYGAVARYSGAETHDAAAGFADEVYATLRAGANRTTDDGHTVTLRAHGNLAPDRGWLDRWRLRKLERPDGLECPVDIACEWLPAAYALRGNGSNPGNYGQYDKGNRPQQQRIEYIVIHDAEGYYTGTTRLGQDVNWPASWHYTMRSVDGQTAQHIKAKDVGWHAGNWYLNAKAVGIEHEGFAAQGTWYTEIMYRTSAKLVRHLAFALGIPLDRQHIIGHDNIPGITPARVGGMHWDPGPYWNWAHYFELLRAPWHGTGTHHTGLVTINPDFTTNRPAFTHCPPASNPGGLPIPGPCPSRGSSSVILRQDPAHDAPLINDLGIRPDGTPNTMNVKDHGARASAGQKFAIAEVRGEWTAIWYLGRKAWLHNPPGARNALWSFGFVARPKEGRATIPVYGRAYPEQAAYPANVPYQPLAPLQYTFAAGQRYVVGDILPSEYYRAVTFDGSSPGDRTVVEGEMRYVQIQFGHRIMYVNLDDVDILPSIF
ncbi:peptidoglycan recognition protein family protein [Allorhizocola rhizosphaerae]|uniref:peptidoglycan recognition protein family protein n=1 Tax=Allorhizocola rhizosphaerae TaxID=1872709 RepID=UPI000E3D7486|nr:peptidoglycan recognition family protein [Allorhizocola rhizosphaerae]